MNGALLIHKPEGITSFGVIEQFKRHLRAQGIPSRDLPKLGHGGTLDPFATGLLVVLVGNGVKLAQYFLNSKKTYSGLIRFGESTQSGDYTNPILERSDTLPQSIEDLRKEAAFFCSEPYLQIPPMHSAKKKNGIPLYELARSGIEIPREPKLCQIYRFEIESFNSPRASFYVECSSGTYIRTLAQDLAKRLGSIALLETLHRTASGPFNIHQAWTLDQFLNSQARWDQLPCWVPFDGLLKDVKSCTANEKEYLDLVHGKQQTLESLVLNCLDQSDPPHTSPEKSHLRVVYHQGALVAIARKSQISWKLDRVFVKQQ